MQHTPLFYPFLISVSAHLFWFSLYCPYSTFYTYLYFFIRLPACFLRFLHFLFPYHSSYSQVLCFYASSSHSILCFFLYGRTCESVFSHIPDKCALSADSFSLQWIVPLRWLLNQSQLRSFSQETFTLPHISDKRCETVSIGIDLLSLVVIDYRFWSIGTTICLLMVVLYHRFFDLSTLFLKKSSIYFI